MKSETILKYFKRDNLINLIHDELEGCFDKLPNKIFIGPDFSPQVKPWVKENEESNFKLKKHGYMFDLLGVPVYLDSDIEGQNVRYEPYEWS